MRVTNKMLSNSFLNDMRTNLQNMRTLQQQMTSGKEIRRPSDDPFKVARAMQMHTDINTNKQYNENIKDTINWLDTTDTALNQAGNVLQRVRELLVSSGNAGYSPKERRAIKDEVNAKMGEMAQILNTNFDGKYVFAGTRGTTKPLEVLNPYVSSISSVTSQSGAAAGSIKGDFLGGSSKLYRVTTQVDASNKVTGVKVETRNNETEPWSAANNISITAAANDKPLDIDIGNGMKLHLEPSSTNLIKKDAVYEFKTEVTKPSENTKLQYYKEGGGALPTVPEIEVKNVDDWKDKKIVVNFGGKDYEISTGSPANLTELVSNINSSIGAISDLSGKLTVSENSGKIKFTADSSAPNMKITGVKNASNDVANVPGMESFYYKDIANLKEEKEINMISSKLVVEISQGVTMDYSVSASDVINFENESGEAKNLMDIFSSLVNHLDGKDDLGAAVDDEAVKKLVSGDLQDITDSLNNLLKVRAQVGATQNRMDGAKEKNTDETFNMTEILSKTEDIDITEKVMEYATMQTIYLASLQTSAKVLQPTLLDYLR